MTTHAVGRRTDVRHSLSLTTLSGRRLHVCPACKYELADCPSCGSLQCRCIASIPIDGKLKVHAGIRKHWR